MRSIAWWPTLVVIAVATFTDLRSRRIPNWLVLPFLLAGIALSPWRHDWSGLGRGFWQGGGQGFDWHGLGLSCAGLGLGFLFYGVQFWLGGMGAGDVKLGAAIGAWIGPVQMFWALFYAALAAGMMILCWIAYRGFKRLLLGAGGLIFGGKRNGMGGGAESSLADLLKSRMPYAPAIAIGTLISFFAC